MLGGEQWDDLDAWLGGVDPAKTDQLVVATEITLPEEEVAYMEEPYKPVVNLLSIGTS